MSIHKSITVARPLTVAFRVFTEEIGKWWPLKEGVSHGGTRANEIWLEGKKGGRLFERFVDGEEFDIGEVTVYEPPHRVVFTWKGRDWVGTTEVDVRFTASGDGTRVDLEHRGWEQVGRDTQAQYEGGWDFVLSRYSEWAKR